MKSPAMPASASAQPRLTCRLARAWSAWREDDTTRPAPGAAARHAARCPACAQHFAALAALESDLRRAARVVAAPGDPALPPGLEDRIFAAVRPVLREQAAARRSRRAWSRRLPAVAGAAAALVVATLLWQRSASGPGPFDPATPPADELAFTPQDLRQLSTSLTSLSRKVLNAPAVNTAANAGPDALTAELQALRADGRAALRFLERSFLPAELRAAGRSAGAAAASS